MVAQLISSPTQGLRTRFQPSIYAGAAWTRRRRGQLSPSVNPALGACKARLRFLCMAQGGWSSIPSGTASLAIRR